MKSNTLKIVTINVLVAAVALGVPWLIRNKNTNTAVNAEASADLTPKVQMAASNAVIPTSVNKMQAPNVDRAQPVKNVTLTNNNLIVFRGAVGGLTVSSAQKELLEKNALLPKGEPLYLFLDTPGGSVIAGQQLIETAKSLGREVKTITLFAASMGFHFAQGLGERMIMPAGILMQHQATIGEIGGEVNGNLLSRLGFYLAIVNDLEIEGASRIKVSLDEYKKQIDNEFYIQGKYAVQQNIADSLVNITCDKSLSGTSDVKFNAGFFMVKITYSNCPAITAPLAASIDEQNTTQTPRFFNKMSGNGRGLNKKEVEYWVDIILHDKIAYANAVNEGRFPFKAGSM